MVWSNIPTFVTIKYMSKVDKKSVRKRSRNAGEQIIANGALRDHMSDQQAEMMVEWSLDQIEAKAKATIALEDKAAEAGLNHLVKQMSAIIKEVDTLLGLLPGCDNRVKATAAYEKFAKLVVPQDEMSKDLQNIMQSFLNSIEDADADAVFAHCWAVVETHYQEEER